MNSEKVKKRETMIPMESKAIHPFNTLKVGNLIIIFWLTIFFYREKEIICHQMLLKVLWVLVLYSLTLEQR